MTAFLLTTILAVSWTFPRAAVLAPSCRPRAHVRADYINANGKLVRE